MPLKPIAIVIALLALGAAVWLLVAAARARRRWLGVVLRVTPALLLLALVASLGSYIFGFSAPHPYFNRAAPVPASTVVYHLAYTDPGAQSRQTWTLIATQGQTGKALWQRAMPGAENTLADGGDTVYAVSRLSDYSASQLLALDTTSGAVRWQETLPQAFVNPPLVLANGVVLLGLTRPGAQILALRASDGAQLWSVPMGVTAVDGHLILSATADTLVALVLRPGAPDPWVLQARRMTDGRLLWSASLQANGSVVLGPDAVYELPSHGSLVARDIHTGARLWQFGDQDYFHSGAVSGETLFVAMQHSGPIGGENGRPSNLEKLYALDAASGRLRWAYATQSGNAGTVTAGRDTVYIEADDGIHALRATDGAVRWGSDRRNNWTFEGYSARPAVVGSVLYVTGLRTLPPETLSLFSRSKGQNYLYAVNEADGSVDWAAAVGPVITFQPHIVL